MTDVKNLITDNIDVWTSAIKQKSSQGRGSNKKLALTGIKKLRELILELAVRGKLVPQDPSDEPAVVLLEKIELEKSKLIADQKMKKQKPLKALNDDEKIIELPLNWRHVRLGDIGYWAIGSGFPKAIQGEVDKAVLVSKVSDMNLEGNEKYIMSTNNTVDFETAVKSRLKMHNKGTVIFPKIGGAIATNKRRILAKPTVIDNNCLGITPYSCFESEYLFQYLSSIDLTKYQVGTSVPALSQSVLELIVLGLPPLAEQHRIVAKVDELMALCDQLEQQTEQSLSAHQVLVTELLATLTASPVTSDLSTSTVKTANADSLSIDNLKTESLSTVTSTVTSSTVTSRESSFQQNWQRISEHFELLFTTEDSIEQLKQTILQLAVMGKLVPQNPSDEPASVLLEKIAKEKNQLIKDKKIKKQKPLHEITDEEKPFELPNSWRWARVGELLSLKNGYAFKSTHFVEFKTEYILTTPGNFYEEGGFRHRGTKTKYYNGPIDSEFVFESGDLIIPMTEQAAGLLGSAAFIPTDTNKYLHNQRLGKLSAYSNFTTPEFIYLFFNSSFLREELARTCTGMKVRHTSPDRILSVLIPVMPPEEQHRIVAKVDELMAICDQLKARLTDAQTTQVNLADAVVENALGHGEN